MNEKRVRLKKGTVFGEWHDRDGQWYRSTVVKDTATAFKTLNNRIDAPSREASWSLSQSEMSRKAPAKKTAPVKKATPANVAAAPATKITEKTAKRVLSPEARKTIATAQKKTSVNAAKGAVLASAKAAKKSATKNPAGKKVAPKAAKPVESSTPHKKAE